MLQLSQIQILVSSLFESTALEFLGINFDFIPLGTVWCINMALSFPWQSFQELGLYFRTW
ncbi:hypothetical protein AS159_10260 [Thermotoga sp. Ku-13t]|nr:hypothetical protein AS159_10370 [Thermotoga sp. Ku-13t]KAF2958137.1 hypothetical protein AS159_10260 [Thermotoga sp. Ku-13t]